MADLRRMVKCSNCGNESTIYVNSDLEMSELVVAGKCRCGSTLQITYRLVERVVAPPPAVPSLSSESSDTTVNLDETLFGGGGDLPSDTLRDLMED